MLSVNICYDITQDVRKHSSKHNAIWILGLEVEISVAGAGPRPVPGLFKPNSVVSKENI
jgi:hypothetical protein